MAEEPREEEPDVMAPLRQRMNLDPVSNPPDHVYETYPGSVDTLLLDNVKYKLWRLEMPANTSNYDQLVAVLRGRIYANTDNGLMVWTFGASIMPEVLVGGDYALTVQHPDYKYLAILRNADVAFPRYQQWCQITHPSASGCFLWSDDPEEGIRAHNPARVRIHIPQNTNRIGALRWVNYPYIGVPSFVGGYLPTFGSFRKLELEEEPAAQAEGVQGQQGADQQALIQQLQAQQQQMRWTDRLVQVHQERLDRLTEQLLPVQLEQLNQLREQLQAQQGEIADLRQLLENLSRVLLDTRVDLTQQSTEQQEQIRQLALIADQHQNDIQQTRRELTQQETDQGQRMRQLIEAVMEEIRLLGHQQPLPSSNHQ